jgi:hypothetical protein
MQLNNATGFICLALHITVGSGSDARKALDAAAESAPRELFALITTMIKALGAAAAAPAAAAGDGAAAADAAAPGVAMLIMQSGMLLQLCMDLPQQLPLQQRLVLLSRCMVLTGQLIAQAFAAPVLDAAPEPARQLLLLSATRPGFSATPDFIRRKMRQLLGACAAAITILHAGIEKVALPGEADGAAAAAAAGVYRQLGEQLMGFTRCVVGLAKSVTAPEESDEDDGDSDDEHEDTDSENDQEEEAEDIAERRRVLPCQGLEGIEREWQQQQEHVGAAAAAVLEHQRTSRSCSVRSILRSRLTAAAALGKRSLQQRHQRQAHPWMLRQQLAQAQVQVLTRQGHVSLQLRCST